MQFWFLRGQITSLQKSGDHQLGPQKQETATFDITYLTYSCLAGVTADDDQSPGLPGGVFEDRGDESSVTVRVPDSHVVRETLSAILRVQDQSSPLWQAYAAYEMANGGIKVIRF